MFIFISGVVMGFNVFINIDSSVNVSSQVQLYCISFTWTYPNVSEIPIYLVKPETMDKISPPERRRGIPREYARKIREKLDHFLKEPKRELIDKLIKEFEGYSTTVVALGVFTTKLPPLTSHSYSYYDVAKHVSNEVRSIYTKIKTPAIFLCPERMVDSAKKVSSRLGISVDEAFKNILRAVLIHEQGHAFTWKLSGGTTYLKYKEFHIRVIEEAIAQYIAYTNAPQGNAALYEAIFSKFNEEQPLEYNAWKPLISSLSDPGSAYLTAYTWSNILKGTLTTWLLPTPIPPLIPLLPITIRPPRTLMWRVLHEFYAYLGTSWHEFFHKVIEPLMEKGVVRDELLKLIALTLLHIST